MKNIKTQTNLKSRIAATLIDYTLYFVLLYLYTTTFGMRNEEDTGYHLRGLRSLALPIIWFILFPLMESFNGQTLGHRLTGIKVVSKSGKPISIGQALKRRILDLLDIFWACGIAAIIAIKYSQHHQRLGDLAANTIVVGGEIVRCNHCANKVKLNAEETIKGGFNCPYCEEQSQG